jgi:ABC-type nitrate/sulfonate/bicarbonate transport system substrate-binding protein
MNRRRLLRALAAFAALPMLSFAPPALADMPMGDGGVVRLIASPAGTQSFPPYVMTKFGLDKKYGFTLELIPGGYGPATINALQGGAGDIATLDWVSVSRLKANGIDVIGIAPFLAYVNTIVVPADSTAQSIADLAGKRIGALDQRSFDWIMTRAAAQAAGVDLTKGEIIDGAPALMRGLMEQKQVDASIMWNSLTPDMIVDGNFRILTTVRKLALDLGLPDVPFLIYAAKADWVAANPKNAAAFAAAYREAAQILIDNDEVWTERAVGEMGMAPAAAAILRDGVRHDLIMAFGEGDNDTYKQTFDLLVSVAGAEVFGFSTMPEAVVTLDFNP